MRGLSALRLPLLLPQAMFPGKPIIGKESRLRPLEKGEELAIELIKHSLSSYCFLYARHWVTSPTLALSVLRRLTA